MHALRLDGYFQVDFLFHLRSIEHRLHWTLHLVSTFCIHQQSSKQRGTLDRKWRLVLPINFSVVSSRCVHGKIRRALSYLSAFSRRDWWLLKGLASYLTSLYTRRAFGNNEYRYSLNQVRNRKFDECDHSACALRICSAWSVTNEKRIPFGWILHRLDLNPMWQMWAIVEGRWCLHDIWR